MGTIKQLKYWAYKILPLVYDNSLSYYEVLSKVTSKVNEVINATNQMPDAISEEIKKQLNGDGDVYNNLFKGIVNAIATDEDDATYSANDKEGGELIWLNGTLYEVVRTMDAGTNYIVGNNIVPVSMDTLLSDILKTISANNEYWNTRAAANHDTGTYMWWKGILYRVDADIKINDILNIMATENGTTTGQLTAVTVMDEISKHYLEMHETDNNLQTQIDGNDGDIEVLQSKAVDLQTNIDKNNTAVNNRINNIVAQSGTDNTEIVDARTTSQKEGSTSLASLKARIDRLANESVLTGVDSSHFILTSSQAKSVLGDTPDIINLPVNTIYQIGASSSTGDINNLPFTSWQPFIIINLSYNAANDWNLYILKDFTDTTGTPWIGTRNASASTISWVKTSNIISNSIKSAENNYLKMPNVLITDDNIATYLGETADYVNLSTNSVYAINKNVTTDIANEPDGLENSYRLICKYNSGYGYEIYILVQYRESVKFNTPYNELYVGVRPQSGGIIWRSFKLNTLRGGVGYENFIYDETGAKALLGETPDITSLPINTIYQFNTTSQTGTINNLPFTTSAYPYQIISLNFSNTNDWNVYLLTVFSSTPSIYIGVRNNTNNPVWVNLTSSSNVSRQIESYLAESYKIFLKVGCIGDSYTAGYLRNANQYNPDYSWVKYLSKDSGNEYVNFGVSGATAKSWMSSAKRTEAETNKCQCYLIGLGINDLGSSVTVGTIDDCENAESDTYYRHMYVIIDFVHNLVNDAPIFIQTRPDVENDYNVAIREICTKYHDTLHTHCLDLRAYNYLYSQSAITNNAYQGHYRAAGYANLGKLLERIWSSYIDNNADDFARIDLINYQ